jgi:hypothetical protein
VILWVFGCQRLWITGYYGLMGYGIKLLGNQGGNPKKLWVMQVYELCGVWVNRVLTVQHINRSRINLLTLCDVISIVLSQWFF